MRNLKFRFDDHLVAEQDEIKIERTGGTGRRTLTTEVVLDVV